MDLVQVGNVDSHAKNYSILLAPRRIELAPLYDLMAGLDWPNITQNHAQAVDDQRRASHLWSALAADGGGGRAFQANAKRDPEGPAPEPAEADDENRTYGDI